MTPTVQRVDPALTNNVPGDLNRTQAVPPVSHKKTSAGLPALNEGNFRQVAHRPPADLDVVEMVRCYQNIEQTMNNRPNLVIQFATPTISIAHIDNAHAVAWAGAMILGRRILLIDAGHVSAPAQGPAGESSDPAKSARTGYVLPVRDMAVRWPVITQLRNMKQLSDVVAGNAVLEDAIVKESSCRLCFATIDAEGFRDRTAVGARAIHNLLTDLRPNFDMILITASATLDGPSATMLSSIVDGTVIVLEQKSRRATLQRALDLLQSGGAPILGVIFSRNRSYLPKWLQRFHRMRR